MEEGDPASGPRRKALLDGLEMEDDFAVRRGELAFRGWKLGDADFVPALKFARKEGLRVYLETLGHSVRRELKAHADVILG